MVVAFLLPVVLASTLLLATGGFDRPPWGDEDHFHDTVLLFSQGDVEHWDYPEVVPPLTFVAYAAWGRLFGTDLANLRPLSMLLAGIASLLSFVMLRRCTRHDWQALLVTAWLLINPYFTGAGAFIYTDMLFQVFVLGIILALLDDKPLWFLVTAALALLTRQYAVSFLLSAGLIGLLGVWRSEKRQGIWWLIAAILPMFPLLLLMLQWGGLSPPAGLAKWTLNEPLRWNPHTFTTLIAMLVVYSAPLLLLAWKLIRVMKGSVWIIPAAAGFYLLFPVRASQVTVVQMGIDTVGLVHKAMNAVLPDLVVHGVLLVAFVFGCVVLFNLFASNKDAIRRGFTNTGARLLLVIASYIAVLPLSYQNWEKYLLPILLPVAVLLVLNSSLGHNGQNRIAKTT